VKNECLEVKEVFSGKDCNPSDLVPLWLEEYSPALVCVDAPLGWPAKLSRSLVHHQAGDCICASLDEMFSRFTDYFVTRCVEKKPLEVGANLIARTALSALQFLGGVRKAMRDAQQERKEQVERDILPLVWKQCMPEKNSVIEVYPAGTLMAWKLCPTGYKGHSQCKTRENLLESLEKIGVRTKGHEDGCLDCDHQLDAVLCLLAGWDFLQGMCLEPPAEMKETIRKEGWIWVRVPEKLPDIDFCQKARPTPS
jgi:hypothetical protein